MGTPLKDDSTVVFSHLLWLAEPARGASSHVALQRLQLRLNNPLMALFAAVPTVTADSTTATVDGVLQPGMVEPASRATPQAPRSTALPALPDVVHLLTLQLRSGRVVVRLLNVDQDAPPFASNGSCLQAPQCVSVDLSRLWPQPVRPVETELSLQGPVSCGHRAPAPSLTHDPSAARRPQAHAEVSRWEAGGVRVQRDGTLAPWDGSVCPAVTCPHVSASPSLVSLHPLQLRTFTVAHAGTKA
jgi:hypothetical protein